MPDTNKQSNDLKDMGKCEECANSTICKNVEQMNTIKTSLNKILTDNNLSVLEIGFKCTFFANKVVPVSSDQKFYNEITR